ncbi:eCIS core domain-containing protein [Pseudonocardia sp. CA-142604]|uniref:eCIS core domain-containing protein n=1 Tax=Pseudonocardia sp. CA-142604 TaxID=3240024 RepID=UPI003D8AA9CE
MHDVLASPGRPLDAEQRREFEGPLGADLSSVRVHSGDTASSSAAAAVDAQAFTSGDHVVFGGPVDRHTLAHELAHVVQQRRGPVAGTDNGDGLRVSDPGDRFEREADATADALVSKASPIQRVAGGGPPEETGSAGGVAVQRAASSVESVRGSVEEADITEAGGQTETERQARFSAWRNAVEPRDPLGRTLEGVDERRQRLGWRQQPLPPVGAPVPPGEATETQAVTPEPPSPGVASESGRSSIDTVRGSIEEADAEAEADLLASISVWRNEVEPRDPLGRTPEEVEEQRRRLGWRRQLLPPVETSASGGAGTAEPPSPGATSESGRSSIEDVRGSVDEADITEAAAGYSSIEDDAARQARISSWRDQVEPRDPLGRTSQEVEEQRRRLGRRRYLFPPGAAPASGGAGGGMAAGDTARVESAAPSVESAAPSVESAGPNEADGGGRPRPLPPTPEVLSSDAESFRSSEPEGEGSAGGVAPEPASPEIREVPRSRPGSMAPEPASPEIREVPRSRPGSVAPKVATEPKAAVKDQEVPSQEGPAQAGSTPARPPAPSLPGRIAEGWLSGGDRVITIQGGDNVVIDRLVSALPFTLSAGDREEARAQWADTLGLGALQPRLSAMTRGDSVTVPMDVGGWSGPITVSARIMSVAPLAPKTVEFEAGGDRFSSTSELSESRERLQGQFGGTIPIIEGGPTLGVTPTGRVLQDKFSSGTTARTGRAFARTKTKEKAAILDSRIQLKFDFSELQGPRSFYVVGSRQRVASGKERYESKTIDAISADLATPISAGAGPAGRLLPPQRVQQTLALGGTDVVNDVHALTDRGTFSSAGVPGLLRSIEDNGQALFGTDWPAVNKGILSFVSITSLQRDLKAMMVGDGIAFPLPNELGSIRIGAQIVSMSHHHTTKETEFNVGTDTSSSTASSGGSNEREEFTAPIGLSGLGGGVATGSLTFTPFAEYGRDGRESAQASARSGAGMKMKVPGAVFDGVAKLSFKVRRPGKPGQPTLGEARIGFQAIVDAAEAIDPGSKDPQEFVAKGLRQRLTAPAFTPGEKIRRASTEILGGGGSRSGGGLPSTAVILDVLAGEGGEHNPVADRAGQFGEEQLGRSWAGVEATVLGTFSRERLASSIAAMSRGVPLQSPPLILPIPQVPTPRQLNPLKPPYGEAWVSATAALQDLEYVRELSPKAELNVLNDVSTSSGSRHNSYKGAGFEVGGAATIRTPTPNVAVDAPAPTVGYRRRWQRGTRATQAFGSIASGKFARPNAPMHVFLGTASVTLTLIHSEAAPVAGPQTQVQFLVALPHAHTEEHVVGSTAGRSGEIVGGPGEVVADSPEIVVPEAEVAAAPPAPVPAAGGGLGPVRVRSSHQIGFSDVVVQLGNDMAVINAVRAAIGDRFGDRWEVAQAKLLPVFDRAAIQPLVPALTHGRRWGTSVRVPAAAAGARDVTADVAIVGAQATMTKHTDSVSKFEFEVGSDSTTGGGTQTVRRNRYIGQNQTLSVAAQPQGTALTANPLNLAVNIDDTSGSTQDVTGGTVNRAKIVEPAQLFEGSVTFTIEIEMGGSAEPIVAHAVMSGEFAFPARDMPQEAGQGGASKLFSVPGRIKDSLRLGGTDVVLDLLPPHQRQPVGASATQAEAGAATQNEAAAVARAEPPAQLSAAGILNQLDARAARIFGSTEKWNAARPALAAELNIDELKQRFRSMMAGRGWEIQLGEHGDVTITASVEEMAHATHIGEPVEFNTGIAGGLVLSGGADGPLDEDKRVFYREASQLTRTVTQPDARTAVTPGQTYTYERGTDSGSGQTRIRQTGVGTKSKDPGSVYDGVALLHFEFDLPSGSGAAAAAPSGPSSEYLKSRQERWDEIGKEVRTLDDKIATPGISDDEKRRAGADRAEKVEELTDLVAQQNWSDRRRADAQQIAASASRTPEARVRFTAMVETADAHEVENAEDARFSRYDDKRAGTAGAENDGRRPAQGTLAHDHITTMPDFGSVEKMLDVYGDMIYGRAWSKYRSTILSELSAEQIMVNLPAMTQGIPLETTEINGLRPGRITLTAQVKDDNRWLLDFLRESKADVALVAESTDRLRSRERSSNLHESNSQLGIGPVTFSGGGSWRNRKGVEVQIGGRLVSNSKVTQQQARFAGHAIFAMTFYPGLRDGFWGRESSSTMSFALPVTVSMSAEDTYVPR